MTEREIKAGADALFNIAMAHGYRLNDVEAREGARAVLRAAERIGDGECLPAAKSDAGETK